MDTTGVIGTCLLSPELCRHLRLDIAGHAPDIVVSHSSTMSLHNLFDGQNPISHRGTKPPRNTPISTTTLHEYLPYRFARPQSLASRRPKQSSYITLGVPATACGRLHTSTNTYFSPIIGVFRALLSGTILDGVPTTGHIFGPLQHSL